MEDTVNPYFAAVEATTQAEARQWFQRLLREAIKQDPSLNNDIGHAKEIVVASLCYVAGYYSAETRERVGHLYAHHSPYRQQPEYK